MSDDFIRQGDLKSLASYPEWAQTMADSCAEARESVASHELFHQMRDAKLSQEQVYTFFVAVWPVIEQFPQYMALNLLKVQYGRTRGHDLARKYLIRNIRVEQNHADHWMEWALASGLSRDDLLNGEVPLESQALSHWCWHTCERDALAAAMAATNYAIEGVTGDWSALVCSSDRYENLFRAGRAHQGDEVAEAARPLRRRAPVGSARDHLLHLGHQAVTARLRDGPQRGAGELRIHAPHARPLPRAGTAPLGAGGADRAGRDARAQAGLNEPPRSLRSLPPEGALAADRRSRIRARPWLELLNALQLVPPRHRPLN